MKKNKKGNLQIDISVTDTDLFKGVIGLLSSILRDEKIEESIRVGYYRELDSIVGHIFDIEEGD